jgi:hypothetical protein
MRTLNGNNVNLSEFYKFDIISLNDLIQKIKLNLHSFCDDSFDEVEWLNYDW